MWFADTSFWVALLRQRDAHHRTARRLLDGGLGRVLTTNHVLGETWTFLRRRGGHGTATGFLAMAEHNDALTVTHVTESVEEDAWSWLRAHGEREYSFVDATSFAVMRRRRLSEALAFDGDFAAAGFTEVRPER